MPAMLKRQQFEDNENNATEPSVSKCRHVDRHDNEKGQGLEEYQNKGGR